MKLIVQPDAGMPPIVTAIKQARKSIDILIFRLDRGEIARALCAAVGRGVVVRALTAHTNRGGEKSLRKLEMQLLDGGVTVSRTAADLVRYHGKMMIIDGRVLHVYGFNFTVLDIGKGEKKNAPFGFSVRTSSTPASARMHATGWPASSGERGGSSSSTTRRSATTRCSRSWSRR